MAASSCASVVGTPPARIATPAQLYETLRASTNAQLLAIELLSKQIADECAWVYEVKVLTAAGSVVELEFSARDLNLVGARGPKNDHDAAALIRSFAGGANLSITSSADSDSMESDKSSAATSSAMSDGNDGGGNSDGEGGSSGGSGGEGGGDDGGGDDGGGDDGGGDDGGGEDGGGEDGGSEGGDGGGEGGGDGDD